jgi:hypothetical protein
MVEWRRQDKSFEFAPRSLGGIMAGGVEADSTH